MALPTRILTTAQVRALDRFAIEQCGVPGYTLMTRAASAALDALRQRWPRARRVRVLCGGGNNGGDGYVLARLASARGLEVSAVALVAAERLRGDAQRAFEDARAAGVPISPFSDSAGDADVLVDSLLGTGLDRPVAGAMLAAIRQMNASGIPILALDVPSGLHSDTGHVMGDAVRASATVTFVGLKVGCFVGHGLAHCGALHFASLELSDDREAPVLERLDEALLAQLLPPRHRDAHKGTFGHVLVVGGGKGTPGAVGLAAEAALRAGAGLVSVATRAENVAPIVSARPEVMAHGVGHAKNLATLIERATVIVIGPGLGRDAWAQSMLTAGLAADRPLVIDADALNLIATQAVRRASWILTPHPAEAGRLLGIDTARVQEDRIAAVTMLAERFGGVAVLKGAGTLISTHGRTPAVCAYGNPGMATAGTGDVLTGVIGGLLAQLRDPWNSACAGVLAHALAGDRAARAGERGTIASDLFEHLRACLNPSAN